MGFNKKRILLGLSQWFLNFNVYQNLLEGLLKYQLLGSIPRVSVFIGLDGVREFVSHDADTAGLKTMLWALLSKPVMVVPFSLPVTAQI